MEIVQPLPNQQNLQLVGPRTWVGLWDVDVENDIIYIANCMQLGCSVATTEINSHSDLQKKTLKTICQIYYQIQSHEPS